MDKNNKSDVTTLIFYLLIRQMGGLADCFRHIQRDDSILRGDIIGWRGIIQSELSDTLCLVRKACDLFDLDYGETEIMGETRDAEKKREYLARHPEEFWI